MRVIGASWALLRHALGSASLGQAPMKCLTMRTDEIASKDDGICCKTLRTTGQHNAQRHVQVCILLVRLHNSNMGFKTMFFLFFP